MPVYLAHGFRWAREGLTGVRVHTIVHNLEDVAVEYIQNAQTVTALLEHFRKEFPSQMQHLEDARSGRTLHFLEQYNPDDESSDAAVSQAHAFVADRVVVMAARPGEVTSESSSSRPGSKASQGAASADTTATASVSSSPTPRRNPAALSLNLDEVISAGSGGSPQAWEALAQIRDKIAEGEKIGWWVVYNGDPERLFDDDEESYDLGVDEDNEEEQLSEDADEEGTRTPTQTKMILGQPVPSLLPDGFASSREDADAERKLKEERDTIGTAIHHPPPEVSSSQSNLTSEERSAARPKSSRAFVNPLSIRKKSSKSNLQTPKEDIPEPPKLKEISKKEGFRHKFFGRGNDKK